MYKKELFYCCRTGNLSRICYLVEEKDVDLNIKDKWDGTPLYYACLCGHYDVVLYLLQNGVSCDANTFDGERCLYGALTDNIRHLLENFKVITSVTMKRDRYSEFLRRSYETSEHSDVEFIIENEKVLAHRCVLSSRSMCLKHHFMSSWKNKTIINLMHLNVPSRTFKYLLQYLYMGEISFKAREIEDFILIAKHFTLYSLVSDIKRILSSKKNSSVLYLQSSHLPQQDYMKLFISSLPIQLREESEFEEPQYVDVKIQIKDCIFSCHKVFICGRCSYLNAIVIDHFSETLISTDDGVQVITLHDIEPEIFSKILQYIYTDTIELLPVNVLTILSHADIFMLNGLKKKCSSFLQDILTAEDVIPVIKVARFYDQPRLEDRCAEFIAKHLEMVITQPEFIELVKSDAQDIKNRQEIDTISIVDDIRYHIDN